ncbi:uncharacterized protein METZ01_LOCUS461572, partial [marine metagenome]
MRRTVLSTFLFAAILGLGCMGVAVSAKAYGHCEDPNDPQYDPNECEEVSGGNSLDKAIDFTAKSKASTAKFKTAFVLPPRKISDITEFLSLQKRRDEAVLGRLQREADQKPPATKDTGDLASFYFKRATAASHLGRGKQAIQDNRKAADLAIRDYPGSFLARFATHNYALEELLYGNYGKGVKGMEESLSHSTSTGAQLARQIMLAGLYAAGG